MNNERRGALRTLFLNGEEVVAFELSGDAVKDLAAAREFLARQADRARQRSSEASPDAAFAWLQQRRSCGLRLVRH